MLKTSVKYNIHIKKHKNYQKLSYFHTLFKINKEQKEKMN